MKSELADRIEKLLDMQERHEQRTGRRQIIGLSLTPDETLYIVEALRDREN